MRASRVFRLLFRIFILVLTISVTLVSILGGLSAIRILMAQDNIGLDFDNAVFDLQLNNSTYEIEDFNFVLPFNFTNSGFFDLENLELSIDLAMNYSHVDYPIPGVNTTRQIQILTVSENFGTIRKGQTGIFSLIGDITDLNLGVLPNFSTEVDLHRGPPPIEYYANITISLDYSLGLHRVTIGVNNLRVEGMD